MDLDHARDTRTRAPRPAPGPGEGVAARAAVVPEKSAPEKSVPERNCLSRATGRRYAGLEGAERAEERRHRLVEAGIELFGTTGYAGTKVKDLCRQAGLSERYFYESFDGREELLLEVVCQLAAEGLAASRAASGAVQGDISAAARVGLTALVGFMVDDPRRARIVLIEAVGVCPPVEEVRLEISRTIADIIVEEYLLPQDPGDERPPSPEAERRARVGAVAQVGATNHLLVEALLSDRPMDKDVIIEVCLDIFEHSRATVARMW